MFFLEALAIAIVVSGVLWLFGVDGEVLVAGWVWLVILAVGWIIMVGTGAWMIRNWFPICGC
jgi:hypothetical protein